MAQHNSNETYENAGFTTQNPEAHADAGSDIAWYFGIKTAGALIGGAVMYYGWKLGEKAVESLL